MIPTHRRLEYASGYIALGMHKDAATELALIEGEAARSAEALRGWMHLHHETRNWTSLIEVATALTDIAPTEEQGWISWAYALRELKRVREAQLVLQRAEPLHGKASAVLHYNLACYACLLGERDEAKRRLARAFKMDPEFRQSAPDDPDLEAMRGEFPSLA